jgi:hypothetical protein
VTTPVRFHSNSSRRGGPGGRARRHASTPFIHRMIMVATKTVTNTAALVLMVVQKTCA